MSSLKWFSASLPYNVPLYIEKNLTRQFHIKRFTWKHLCLPFGNNHFVTALRSIAVSDNTRHSFLLRDLSPRDLLSWFFPRLQKCGLWERRTGEKSKLSFCTPPFGAPTTISRWLCRQTRHQRERALQLFSWINMPDYAVSIKSCATWERIRGQDLIHLQKEPWVLYESCDKYTHPSSHLQILCDNSTEQFFLPEILILKPISADDLAKFRDEVT